MAFRNASENKLGGKFLVFGNTGSGKSCFGLTFPRIAAVDSESGLAHYEHRPIMVGGKAYQNLVLVDNTADIDELESNIDDIANGEFDDKISTLLIDSETKFYNSMQVGAMEVEMRRARKTGGDIDDQTVSQRQWGRIKLLNMKLQQAKIDLSTRGIHVVSIAQEADLRDKQDSDKIIGEKADMHKTAAYDYDTVLHCYTETDKKTGEVKFFAKILKDRTLVTTKGNIIENCTYDVWKDYFEGKSKLETAATSYKKDLEDSTNSMVDKADRIEDMITEWKLLMKGFAASKEGEAKAANVKAKMSKLKMTDIKNLHLYDIKDVTELYEFTKSLA